MVPHNTDAAGIYVGGGLASASLVFVRGLGWRDTSVLLGVLGLCIVLCFCCLVPEPQRVRGPACAGLCAAGGDVLLAGHVDPPPPTAHQSCSVARVLAAARTAGRQGCGGRHCGS